MDDRVAAGTSGGARLLRITWVKSGIGFRESQRLTIKSLGLRKLHQSVEHYDSPSIRGMLTKVRHLVRVEEAAAGKSKEVRETGTQRFAARLRAKAAAREALLAALNGDEAVVVAPFVDAGGVRTHVVDARDLEDVPVAPVALPAMGDQRAEVEGLASAATATTPGDDPLVAASEAFAEAEVDGGDMVVFRPNRER